ncbi:hypothetical protein EV210_111128 [Anaerospora hongkongensis]|uniref:Uncharacterized protein n=1 Tax=Anaerospora hongkongensis TaxID=244830 RepID=A0A4R1PW32_9FIRM|nr:hypothetical protein [Anaerospora hongkongensis]TCL35662.1 hypothetical protein EV210_111128 [Anaerospora hongkongensis]
MELTLSNTVQIISVIGFLALLVKQLIINPLQAAISSLNKAVEELKGVLTRIEREQNHIDRRLVVVEESAKSAHKRLDGMEGR